MVEPCVEFLERQAKSLNLTFNVYRLFEVNTPIVVMSWIGEYPTLPSIVLNSHMDVVPAYPELWSYPPFAAHIDENGRIYARGAQDTKSIGMQHLAAIRELKRSGTTQLKRTLHVTFVPEEEVGGTFGMKSFVQHDVFKSLNIGFVLDEGYMCADDTYRIYYGERSNWSMFYLIAMQFGNYKFVQLFFFLSIAELIFKFSGHTGHGSVNFRNTAAEKLAYIMQKLYKFRQTQIEKMENDSALEEGDISSINLTIINGGVLRNVVPATISATFDLRLTPSLDLKAFEQQVCSRHKVSYISDL